MTVNTLDRMACGTIIDGQNDVLRTNGIIRVLGIEMTGETTVFMANFARIGMQRDQVREKSNWMTLGTHR